MIWIKFGERADEVLFRDDGDTLGVMPATVLLTAALSVGLLV